MRFLKKPYKRYARLSKENLSLLLVLACASLIRGLFFTGLVFQGDLLVAERIWQIVALFKTAPESLIAALLQARTLLGGWRKLIYYAPTTLVTYVFDSNLILPFILSIANAWLIYAITRALADKKAALFSVLLWAFFPLDIFYSTAALNVAPLAFFFLLSIWAFLAAIKNKKRWGYAICLASILTILLVEAWLALAAGTLLISIFLSAQPKQKRVLTFLWTFIGIGLLVTWSKSAGIFLGFYSLIRQQAEFVFLLPLFFVALAVILMDRQKQDALLFFWPLAVLAGLIGKRLFRAPDVGFDLSYDGTSLLVFFTPLVILAGVYISRWIKEKQVFRWTTSLAVIGALGALLAVIGAKEFLPTFYGFDWIGLHSLFLIYFIMAGICIAGILASPLLFSEKENRWKNLATFGLLMIILFATLPFSWQRRNEYHYLAAAPAEAWQFIQEKNDASPIYTLSPETQQRFSFLARAEPTQAGSVPQQISLEETSEIAAGYLIAFEDELPAAPRTWWQVGHFGPLGTPKVAIYRVLSLDRARQALREAQKGSLSSRDRESLYELYGSAINSGGFCEGYLAWASAVERHSTQLAFIPINPEANCFLRNDPLMESAELQNNKIEGYIIFSNSFSTGEIPTFSFRQVTTPVYDMRTISVNLLLKPNTLYLYSVEIQTISPTATLYWSLDGKGDYLEMRSYPDWTRLAILLVTPDWSGEAMTVSFSPALFDHLELVSLRNFYIGPVVLQNSQ